MGMNNFVYKELCYNINMNRIVKKVVELLFIFYFSATTIFFLSRLAPSDPIEIILGENATFEDRVALKKELRIDKPILNQYIDYLLNLSQLDFGNSYVTKKSVISEIGETLPETMKVALISLLLSTFFSIILAISSSYYEKKFFDKFYSLLTSIMIVSPSFLIGPLLLLLFAVKIHLFPISRSYLLAGFALSIPFSAYSSRVLRASILEEREKDYFRTSLQKGNSKFKTFIFHLFPNSLPPFVQLTGLHFGSLLTGAIIAEKIFRIKGMGSLLLQSVWTRDYPLLTGIVVIFTLVYLLSNFLSDLLTSILDPRIRYEK